MSELIESIFAGENFRGVQAALEKAGDKKALECLNGMRREIEKLPELINQMRDQIKLEVIEEVTPVIKKEYDTKFERLVSTMSTLATDLKNEKKKRLMGECKALETTIFINGINMVSEAF